MTISGLAIGYARVSTDAQDLTAQRGAFAALGVPADRVHVDHGLSGTNRGSLVMRCITDPGGERRTLSACLCMNFAGVAQHSRTLLFRQVPQAQYPIYGVTGLRCEPNRHLYIGPLLPGRYDTARCCAGVTLLSTT